MAEYRTNIDILGDENLFQNTLSIKVSLKDEGTLKTDLSVSALNVDNTVIDNLDILLNLNNVDLNLIIDNKELFYSSGLYLSSGFDSNFNEVTLWKLLNSYGNEQIDISHLRKALSSYDMSSNAYIMTIKDSLNSHINNTVMHLSEEEHEFLTDIFNNRPWNNPGGGGSGTGVTHFQYVNVGTEALPNYALKPLLYKDKNVGIFTDSFISCKGADVTALNGSFDEESMWEILTGPQVDPPKKIKSHFLELNDIDLSQYFDTDGAAKKAVQLKYISSLWGNEFDGYNGTGGDVINGTITFGNNATIEPITVEGQTIGNLKTDAGFYSTNFISCKGLDATALSVEYGGLDRYTLFEILSNEPLEGEFINLDYLIGLDEKVESFGYLKNFVETDPTVPTHVKNISTDDINSWNIAASLFTVTDEHLLINENRGLVSNSYLSCKGVDSTTAAIITDSLNREDLFTILSGNPLDNEFINPDFIDINFDSFVTTDALSSINNTLDLHSVKIGTLESYFEDGVAKESLVARKLKYTSSFWGNSFDGSASTIDGKITFNTAAFIDPTSLGLHLNQGIYSDSFVSCKGVDVTSISGNSGLDRITLFSILTNTPQEGEFINLDYLDLSYYNNEIQSLNTKTQTLNTSLTSLSNNVNLLSTKVDTNTANITNLTSRVSTAESNISTLQSYFDSNGNAKSALKLANITKLWGNNFDGTQGVINGKITFSNAAYFNPTTYGINTNKGFYSDLFISCKGVDSTSSIIASTDLNTVWESLTNHIDNYADRVIDVAHIPLITVDKISDLNDVLSNYTLKSDIATAYRYKGSVQTYSQLPSNAAVGDVYNVIEVYQTTPSGTNYAWTGTTWDALGGSIDTSVFALKAIKILAGNGLTGGGTLEANRTIVLGTPSTITNTSTNSVTESSHTHSIDKASTTVTGIVKLNDTLLSESTTLALTAKQGNVLHKRVTTLEDFWEDKTTYLLAKRSRGIVSNAFISCKGLDSNTAIINSGLNRQDLFTILKGTPENNEYINLAYLDLSSYATTSALNSGLITKQDAITTTNKLPYSLISDTPTISNSKITITQNGVEKGSFTLNQSSAKTIEVKDTTYGCASATSLGLVKIGSNISVTTDGTISIANYHPLNGSSTLDFSAKNLTASKVKGATLVLPTTTPSLASGEIGIYAGTGSWATAPSGGLASVTKASIVSALSDEATSFDDLNLTSALTSALSNYQPKGNYVTTTALSNELANYQPKITSTNKLSSSLVSGLGSLATKSSLSFSELTSTPTTIAGYGISDAITTANIGSQSVADSAKLGGINAYNIKKHTAFNLNSSTAERWVRIAKIERTDTAGVSGEITIHNNYYTKADNILKFSFSAGYRVYNSISNISTLKILDSGDSGYKKAVRLVCKNNIWYIDVLTIESGNEWYITLDTISSKLDTITLNSTYEGISSYDGYIVVKEAFANKGVQADTLATSRTLWGQSFDGSGNVDGDLTANGTIKGTALILPKAAPTSPTTNELYLYSSSGSWATTPSSGGSAIVDKASIVSALSSTATSLEDLNITSAVNSAISNSISGKADISWVTNQAYATQTWVTDKGYATSSALSSGLATKQDKITTTNKLSYSLISGTPTIPTALKSPYSLTFGTKTYDGSSAKTITASDLGAITSVSSSMVTTALGYTPYNSANFTKANIKSTLGIADWALASAKPSYSASEISGLGSLATKNSVSFAEITSKPTTISGYGITDAVKHKQSNNFYPFIKTINRSNIVKIEFPFEGSPTGNRWFLMTFELALQSVRYNNPSGRVFISYYPRYINNAWIYNIAKFSAIGTNLSELNIYYDTSSPNVLYVKCSNDSYNVLSLVNLSGENSCVNYDFTNTILSSVDSIPSTCQIFTNLKYSEDSDLKVIEGRNLMLRVNQERYYGGIGWDVQGNECLALWAKNSVTRLRWYAGTDLSGGVTAGSMMGITPDFEISKASGTATGYIGGNTIIHSGNISSQSVASASNLSAVYPQIAAARERDSVYFSSVDSWSIIRDNNVGYRLQHAITFDWYDTKSYFGLVRGGSYRPAGFGWGYKHDANTDFVPTTLLTPSGDFLTNGKVSSAYGHFGHILINKGHGYNVGDQTIETDTSGMMLYMNYYHNGSINMCQGGGNVGIGTTAPTQKLDVNGTIKGTHFILPTSAPSSPTAGAYYLYIGSGNWASNP